MPAAGPNTPFSLEFSGAGDPEDKVVSDVGDSEESENSEISDVKGGWDVGSVGVDGCVSGNIAENLVEPGRTDIIWPWKLDIPAIVIGRSAAIAMRSSMYFVSALSVQSRMRSESAASRRASVSVIF